MAVCATPGMRRGRHVERRAPVEEPVRLQHEPERHRWHDRPVLGAHHMMGAERVPDDDLGVLQRAVGGGVGRQAGPARVLVRIVAGRVALGGIVSSVIWAVS